MICPKKICWPSRWSIDPCRHRLRCLVVPPRYSPIDVVVLAVFVNKFWSQSFLRLSNLIICHKQSFAIDPEVVGMWRGNAMIIRAQNLLWCNYRTLSDSMQLARLCIWLHDEYYLVSLYNKCRSFCFERHNFSVAIFAFNIDMMYLHSFGTRIFYFWFKSRICMV